MARFLLIEGGTVANLVEARSADDLPGMTLVPAPEGLPVAIGWTWDGVRFAPPPRWPSLEVGQAELRARVKARRDALEQSGFAYLGKVLDSDPASAQRLIGAAQLAQAAAATGSPFSIDWTCADDSVLTMDAPQMVGALAALGAHVAALHTQARARKEQIAEAQSIADLTVLEASIEEGWV